MKVVCRELYTLSTCISVHFILIVTEFPYQTLLNFGAHNDINKKIVALFGFVNISLEFLLNQTLSKRGGGGRIFQIIGTFFRYFNISKFSFIIFQPTINL